jgi:hypothetical protein
MSGLQIFRAQLNSRRSGTVVAVGIVGAALALVTAGYGFGLGWVGSWHIFGVPSYLPAFLDLHGVTDNVACAARGINVYLYRDCDVFRRGYNYPPIWLLLGKWGIDGDDTSRLAILIELPTLALFVLLLRGRSVVMGLIALLAILSPSVMMAFERGNIDLVVWSLVCCAALVFSERSISRLAAALVLLGLAVVLKLFAVFCCTLVLRFRRPAIIVSLILFVFSLLYFYSIADVFPMIRANTDYKTLFSYGYRIIFALILGLSLKELSDSWMPVPVVIFVILAVAALAFAAWRRGHRPCKIADGSDGTAFLFGGGIFLGSFLFLGSNYAYRLTFLLLCLPQLFDWIERQASTPTQVPGTAPASDASSRLISLLFLGSCLASMWLKLMESAGNLMFIGQIADWTMFSILTALFVLNGLYAPSAALRNFAASVPPLGWETKSLSLLQATTATARSVPRLRASETATGPSKK